MNVFDFLTAEEIDDLPDDANFAFTEFVRLAQKRLDARIAELDGPDQGQWELVGDAKHGFMNVVIAAAKRFEIEPFASNQVPPAHDTDKHDRFRQFKADLDHYTTQLVLDNSIRGKRESVPLSDSAKTNIRKYIHGLRVEIDKANLTDAKRKALLERLAKFEAELEGRRLKLKDVTLLAFTILGVPGSVWASYEIVAKLTSNMMQVVAEEKVVHDEKRAELPEQKPAALLPPRHLVDQPTLRGTTDDDEIPF